MSYSDIIWRFYGNGYRFHRFISRTLTDLSKPRKSFFNINILKKSKAINLLKKTDKLHLGCGTLKLDNFINIDAIHTPAIDFRCKLNKLYDYFDENSVSEIYICHTLEHLPAKFLYLYLKQFYHIMKIGGVLRVSVPDIEKIMIVARKQQWSDSQVELLQGVIGGGQDHKYNYHKLFFWPDYLRRKLKAAGFRSIEEYPHRPHFAGETVMDASSSAGYEPFGMGLSLNMKAEK